MKTRASPRVRTQDEVLSRLAMAEPEIRGLGVRRLAYFGSFARDAARARSDVDLLVEFTPGAKSFDALMALGDRLERLLGRRVDLVTLESLSPYLGPHILAEARDVLTARGAPPHPR
ncbi:MAG: nucleotidyltransferase family protein [Pseudomonadota bacterium]